MTDCIYSIPFTSNYSRTQTIADSVIFTSLQPQLLHHYLISTHDHKILFLTEKKSVVRMQPMQH